MSGELTASSVCKRFKTNLPNPPPNPVAKPGPGATAASARQNPPISTQSRQTPTYGLDGQFRYGLPQKYLATHKKTFIVRDIRIGRAGAPKVGTQLGPKTGGPYFARCPLAGQLLLPRRLLLVQLAQGLLGRREELVQVLRAPGW